MLTVFIPTFNRSKYLRACLDSLMSQAGDGSDFSIIVSDNASTDDTGSLVASTKWRVPVQYSRNDRNLGILGNFNRALDMVESEYVLLMTDDTALAPWFVSRAIEALRSGATAYATGMQIVGSSGHGAEIYLPFLCQGQWPPRRYEWSRLDWLSECLFRVPLFTGSVALRREVLSWAMPWTEPYAACADTFLYLEAARRGSIIFDSFVGALTVYDGHNYGSGLLPSSTREQYVRMSRRVIEISSADGYDILSHWRERLPALPPDLRRAVVRSAQRGLDWNTYSETFAPYYEPAGRLGRIASRVGVRGRFAAELRRAVGR